MKRRFALLLISALLCVPPAVAGQKAPGKKGSHVVIDQFGYLPGMAKVAVVRSPARGFDKNESFQPGAVFELVDADSRAVVFSGEIVPWNLGKVDPSSGDRAWRFDFSEVEAEGRYYIRDRATRSRSHVFDIGPGVYKQVLYHAFRTFYYQRVGMAREEPWAEVAWADGVSHLGPGQDGEARRFDAKSDPGTARDLRGGWYDAGDYNKYTNWTAEYVVGLLHAWFENPAAWGDDFDIPESATDTAMAAFEWFRAPVAMARATCSLTAPCSSISSLGTPSMSIFASLE